MCCTMQQGGVVAKSSFAKKLRKLREKAGLSQNALGKRAVISKQALSKLETGENELTWETVQRLARALGASYEAFTDPDLPMPSEEGAAPGKPGRPRKANGKTARKGK
jgi:transcriptional regulator with XRE-family HTH domain